MEGNGDKWKIDNTEMAQSERGGTVKGEECDNRYHYILQVKDISQ